MLLARPKSPGVPLFFGHLHYPRWLGWGLDPAPYSSPSPGAVAMVRGLVGGRRGQLLFPLLPLLQSTRRPLLLYVNLGKANSNVTTTYIPTIVALQWLSIYYFPYTSYNYAIISVPCMYHEILAVKFFRRQFFQQKLNTRNILCNLFLVTKVWR